MKDSILKKLEIMAQRFDAINLLLSDTKIMKDHKQLRELGRERAKLEAITTNYRQYLDNLEQINHANDMLETDDIALKELAHEEINHLQQSNTNLENDIKTLLLPDDPHNQSSIFLEIRAGSGGDEASIFVGDLFRMYCRYTENNKWKIEIISASEGEHGGYKEIISRIHGENVYTFLKFESGTHRVQRVPETESQGRIHTSAATVAVLPEVDEVDDVEINQSDLRIDTFRASGAGGQHVNKTDSAIRITHLPTGLVVECQENRSQHRNKARAMDLLRARMLDFEQQRQHQERAQTRKILIGSGDRSERIRTYNYPQGRITDHRIELTLYQLPRLLEGDMDIIIQPLTSEFRAEQMASLDL